MCFFVFCVFFPVDFRGFFGIFFDHEKVLGLAPIFPKNQKFCPFFLSIFAFFFLMGKLLAAYKFSPAESAHLGVAFFCAFFCVAFLEGSPHPPAEGILPPPREGRTLFPRQPPSTKPGGGYHCGGGPPKKSWASFAMPRGVEFFQQMHEQPSVHSIFTFASLGCLKRKGLASPLPLWVGVDRWGVAALLCV